MTVGVFGQTPLRVLLSVDDDSAVIARVIDGWDVEDNGHPYASLIDELSDFRRQVPQEADQLAGTIFRAMVEFGEDLPDMYWVHVAVLCSDVLVYGLLP